MSVKRDIGRTLHDQPRLLKNCAAKGIVTECLVQGVHGGVNSYSPGQNTLPPLAAAYFITVFVTAPYWTSFLVG
jgi:hypothetical protein